MKHLSLAAFACLATAAPVLVFAASPTPVASHSAMMSHTTGSHTMMSHTSMGHGTMSHGSMSHGMHGGASPKPTSKP